MMQEKIYWGSDFKMNVHIDAIDGLTMDQLDFTCNFSTSPTRSVAVSKANMIRIDDLNYVACLSSKMLNRGTLSMRIEVKIPDTDYSSGVRVEVEKIETNLIIV